LNSYDRNKYFCHSIKYGLRNIINDSGRRSSIEYKLSTGLISCLPIIVTDASETKKEHQERRNRGDTHSRSLRATGIRTHFTDAANPSNTIGVSPQPENSLIRAYGAHRGPINKTHFYFEWENERWVDAALPYPALNQRYFIKYYL